MMFRNYITEGDKGKEITALRVELATEREKVKELREWLIIHGLHLGSCKCWLWESETGIPAESENCDCGLSKLIGGK
jgi:hypothetical protein